VARQEDAEDGARRLAFAGIFDHPAMVVDQLRDQRQAEAAA